MKMRTKRVVHAAKQKRVYFYLPNGVSFSWRASDRNGKKKLLALLSIIRRCQKLI